MIASPGGKFEIPIVLTATVIPNQVIAAGMGKPETRLAEYLNTLQFYRQFAVTISVSTVFSAISSLTLSPALAAILLKPHGKRRDPMTLLLDLTLGWFFRLFNRVFGASTSVYSWTVQRMMRVNLAVIFVYGLLILVTYVTFSSAPIGFVRRSRIG